MPAKTAHLWSSQLGTWGGKRHLIPLFNASGVLPPFTGDNSTDLAGTSPYKATVSEVIRRFSTSDERRDILSGLLSYREEMRSLGIESGFQWLDGSFVENAEVTRSRPPKDVDIVTFAYRPNVSNDDWISIIDRNPQVFDSQAAKEKFKVDAYYVDLNIPADLVVQSTTYWYGVFSHQRVTSLWKGMVQVNIMCDDHIARTILNGQDTQTIIATASVKEGESHA